MENIKIKFKKIHPLAQLPKGNHKNNIIEGLTYNRVLYGTHDSGFDLFCCEEKFIAARQSGVVPIGLQVSFIQAGYWFRIESRSGLSFKHGIIVHPGIIDNGYRGSLDVKVYNLSDNSYTFKVGDKVAQIVIYPLIDAIIEEMDEVFDTHRGEKGFGSSGR